MIVTLRHTIEINAAPEAVWAFFDSIEDTYTKWHPNHVVFRWVKGNRFEPNAVAYTEQNMHGARHKMKVTCTEVIPHRKIGFAWGNPLLRFFVPRNEWTLEPCNGGCRFSAEHDIRLGWISSRMKKTKRMLDQTRQHLKKEGENLKRLVEGHGG